METPEKQQQPKKDLTAPKPKRKVTSLKQAVIEPKKPKKQTGRQEFQEPLLYFHPPRKLALYTNDCNSCMKSFDFCPVCNAQVCLRHRRDCENCDSKVCRICIRSWKIGTEWWCGKCISDDLERTLTKYDDRGNPIDSE
jgi:hypothetical protein